MHIKLVNKTYLILDREMAEQSEAEILLQHNIPAPYRIGVAGADMKDEIVLSSISANSSSPNLSSNDISGKIDVTDNEEVGATQP
jgi:hypothetical protein